MTGWVRRELEAEAIYSKNMAAFQSDQRGRRIVGFLLAGCVLVIGGLLAMGLRP